MKLIVKHITSFSLIVIVLVATLQLSVTKMTCLMTGKIVYSIEDIEDCKPVKKGCNVDDVCCDFHKITFDHTVESYSPTIDFVIENINCYTVELHQALFSDDFVKPTLYLFHNLPPPPGGIELLKIIQVYRL